jgi:hypothetical protein
MQEFIEAPIVDIRLIHNTRDVIRYVAKYIAKAPKQFGNAKRYWQSRDYALDKSEKPEPATPAEWPWSIQTLSLETILREWMNEGYASRRHANNLIIAIPVDGPLWPT